MKELRIKPIFNVPYQPKFNAIEEVWSMMKKKYRRELMDTLMGKNENTLR